MKPKARKRKQESNRKSYKESSEEDGSNSSSEEESAFVTPKKTSSNSGRMRSSERIRSRSSREFRMPTKEDVFNAIGSDSNEYASPVSSKRLRSSESSNKFSRITHRYNQDIVSENEGSSLEEFITDGEGSDSNSSKSSSESSRHGRKDTKNVRRRIVLPSSSSSSEEEPNIQLKTKVSAKKRKRIATPPSSSAEDEETKGTTCYSPTRADTIGEPKGLMSPAHNSHEILNTACSEDSDSLLTLKKKLTKPHCSQSEMQGDRSRDKNKESVPDSDSEQKTSEIQPKDISDGANDPSETVEVKVCSSYDGKDNTDIEGDIVGKSNNSLIPSDEEIDQALIETEEKLLASKTKSLQSENRREKVEVLSSEEADTSETENTEGESEDSEDLNLSRSELVRRNKDRDWRSEMARLKELRQKKKK